MDLSNTFKKKFSWKGVICEPDIRLHNDILAKRKFFLEKKPVHNSSNKKIYFSFKEPYHSFIASKGSSSSKK